MNKALKMVCLLALLQGAYSHAAVTDLLSLDSNYPKYGDLYSDVKVGDTTIPTKWNLSNETISAVYAYLHEDSPYRYNSDYLNRLKLLLDARFDQYSSGSGLGDMSGSFQACYAYMLLKHHRPGDITASEIAEWEAAMVAFSDDQLADLPHLYDDYLISNQWLNGDIRMAMGVYFAGVAINNTTYQNKAADAIDLYLTKCISGDGAVHKSGFQNEAPGYRNWNVNWMIWWWKITGSPEAKAFLDKTIPWVPLSVEPSGFAMQTTANAVKHMYNKGFGQESALALGYIYGDGYNYSIGQVAENNFSSEMSVLLAAVYDSSVSALTPPSEFILYDRAVMGPRIRTADWACIGTARSPQTSAPEHPDRGFEGRQCGKNTFVGAAALGTWANGTSLKAALDGVAVEFKTKPGVTNDWARSNYDGGMYRFLAQDEENATITRDNFGSISTSYRLSERVTGGSTPTWGAGTDWLGEQVWLLTKERLVGIVQIRNEVADSVYGLDTRLVLVGGRYPVLGAYHDLVEVAPDEFEFGELKVRVPQTNFNGPRSVQRTTVYGSNTADDYTAILRLHDAADLNNDALINYPAGTRRWAVVECVRDGNSFSNSSINVLPANNSLLVLQVKENNRRVRVIQNVTGTTRTYTGNMNGISGGTATVHKSWDDTVDVITPAPGSPVAMSIDVPPYGHATVVSSTITTDHDGMTSYYEDVFTGGVIPQTPLGAAATNLPGLLEAEYYDIGGDGVAYYDTTAGNSGNYGSDDVDIQTTSDTGGGYNVGWIKSGEWQEHTVNLPDGTYDIVARVASGKATGAFSLKLGDGVAGNSPTTLGSFNVPHTGGWQTWTSLTLSNVTVSNGGYGKILRIDYTGSDFNLNWIEFIPK
ncbi:MAG: carbohydrate-binding protein [Verrucomicrobiota bacterium]